MKTNFRETIKKSLSWYFSRKAMPYWCVLLVDCLIVLCSILAAHFINYGVFTTADRFGYIMLAMSIYLVCYLVAFRIFKTYKGVIRYSSFIDLFYIIAAVLTGSVLVEFVRIIFHFDELVRAAISGHDLLVGSIISILLMWIVRILIKIVYDTLFIDNSAANAVIFGTRSAGMAIAKSMRTTRPAPYRVVGFLNGDKEVTGYKLMNLPVIYAKDGEKLQKFFEQKNVSVVMVSPMIQEYFVNECQDLINYFISRGIKIKAVPKEYEWDGQSDISHSVLGDVKIEDLLPRKKIEVDLAAIGAMLQGKCIFITGAAGSIGREIVRQVASFGPEKMILVDQAETPMHDIRLLMSRKFPQVDALTVVGSICNETQMEQLFSANRPDYVFHAAAYKHVPMMEDNPAMAVQNNIYGTRVVADLSIKYGVKKFVMVSTDKAVNPTNVMGCSKRICEIYCQSLNGAVSRSELQQADGSPAVTQFVTTRFGNVLGSKGSVIPIFREQIAAGGPVTVTHPDITRFFMLIPEACQLVLMAGTMGKGGEIFVFDMGEPVRIADLAQRMIDMTGAKDVKIVFTGLRDGEKLYEEVLSDGENDKPTMHPKIKVATVREYAYSEALKNEKELYELSFGYDDMAIVAKMKEIVPEYKSRHSKYEKLD